MSSAREHAHRRNGLEVERLDGDVPKASIDQFLRQLTREGVCVRSVAPRCRSWTVVATRPLGFNADLNQMQHLGTFPQELQHIHREDLVERLADGGNISRLPSFKSTSLASIAA
jgi:hypothetical protein